MKKIIHRLLGQLFAPPNYHFYELIYLLINILLVATAVHYLGFWISLVWFLPGMVAWVMLEYCLHRFVFHFKTRKLYLRKLVYAIHGVHHANPQDKNKFYVPLVPSLLIALLVFLLLQILMANITYAFLAGLLFMHQLYNLIHLWIHSGKTTQIHYLQKMREHHLLHHTCNGHRYFGVTSKLPDRIFNTY